MADSGNFGRGINARSHGPVKHTLLNEKCYGKLPTNLHMHASVASSLNSHNQNYSCLHNQILQIIWYCLKATNQLEESTISASSSTYLNVHDEINEWATRCL